MSSANGDDTGHIIRWRRFAKKIADFGVFVSLNSSTDGMVHVSELAPFRVDKINDIIKTGMIVPVKVINVDKEKGRIALSIREADPEFFKKI